MSYEPELQTSNRARPHSVQARSHGDAHSRPQMDMRCSLQFADRSDNFFDLLGAFVTAYNSFSSADEFALEQQEIEKVLLQMRAFRGCLLTTLDYFVVTPALTLEDARIKRQVFRAYLASFAEEDASVRLALSAFDDQDRLEGNLI